MQVPKIQNSSKVKVSKLKSYFSKIFRVPQIQDIKHLYVKNFQVAIFVLMVIDVNLHTVLKNYV